MPRSLRQLKPQAFVDDTFGLPTVTDILRELEKPGRDPRPAFKAAVFKEGVETLKDLKPGMILEGTVTNVAAFGAFVDIGVHQDGLVHISAMSKTFIKDPREVVKPGDIVKVKVLEVEVARKRIALTLRLDDEIGAKGERKPSQGKPRDIFHEVDDVVRAAQAAGAARRRARRSLAPRRREERRPETRETSLAESPCRAADKSQARRCTRRTRASSAHPRSDEEINARFSASATAGRASRQGRPCATASPSRRWRSQVDRAVGPRRARRSGKAIAACDGNRRAQPRRCPGPDALCGCGGESRRSGIRSGFSTQGGAARARDNIGARSLRNS